MCGNFYPVVEFTPSRGGGTDSNDSVTFALNATLSTPFGLALDGVGRFYFTERTTGRLRRLMPTGALDTLAHLTPGEAGPVAVDVLGNRVWVGDGDDVRLVVAGELQSIPLLSTRGSDITGLAYDEAGTLYVSTAASSPFGLRDVIVHAIPVSPAGDVATGASVIRVGGTGALGEDEGAYDAPLQPRADAREQTLAGAGYSALHIDLTHAADPEVLSGILYLGNNYAPLVGNRWAQVLRLEPSP